ncbi:MAG: hypothetical protein ACRBDI_01330 [Alphaproteobacteria bacterium]
MRFFFFIALFLMPSLVYADGVEELCDRVGQAKKPPVWGADYVAGVDVHGQRVVPADLSNSGGVLNNPIIIPIDVYLAQRFGIVLPQGIELKPELFKVKVFEDGRVMYNEQNITSNTVDACVEIQEENLQLSPKSHGQNGGDTLPSDDTIQGQYPEYNE